MSNPDFAGLVPGAAAVVSAWLVTYAIHSSVLLVGAAVAARRIRSHSLRETLWKTALFGGFVTASIQSVARLTPLTGRVVMPASVGAAAPAPADPNPAAPTRPLAGPKAGELAGTVAPAPEVGASAPAAARIDWRIVAVAVWLLGAFLLTARYLLRRARFLRSLSARRPVMTHPLALTLEQLCEAAGITRPIRLTASTVLPSPIALGASEIAVPEAALTELDPGQQRGMLAHELAHLDRRDPAWLTAGCLAERLAFFQPLNRLARRRMQESAEYLCDEWAVRRTGSGVLLARCLAKVAEWMDASPRPVPVAGMAEERSHLVSRVRRLLEGAPFHRAPARRTLVMGAFASLALTVVALPAVSSARSQRPPNQTAALDAGKQAPDAGMKSASEHGQSGPSPSGSPSPSPSGSPSPSPSGSPSPSPSGSPSPGDPKLDKGADGILQAADTGRAVINALMEAIRDSDVEVRRAALRSLSRFEDPTTLPAFRSALKDSDPEIRAVAAEALGERHDRGSIAAIADLLRDESPEVRRSAAQALGEIPRAGVRDQLIAALKDVDAEVRANVIEALSKSGDAAAADALISAVHDPKADVRAKALEALTEFELDSPPAVLLDALKDPSAEVRHQAAHAVGHFEDARAVPMLRTLIEDPNGDVREAAIEALADIRTEAAIAAIVSALKSKDPKVRRAAADALGQH